MFQTERLDACGDACLRCAAECEFCVEACARDPNCDQLSENMALMATCVQLCRLTAEFIRSESALAHEVARSCAEICLICAAECQQHELDHCQRCARRCQECAEECQRVAMTPAHAD